MTANRRDRNEREIVAALEDAGYRVWAMAPVRRRGSKGLPDLIVVCPGCNLLWLLEVKMPGAGVRAEQREALKLMNGYIVRSTEEALLLVDCCCG